MPPIRDLIEHGLPERAVELLERRGLQTLTRVQSMALKAGLLQGAGLLISAPTSSGKTLAAELLALKSAGDGLLVYLVSHKALARQVWGLFDTWYRIDDAPYLRVGLLTGDEDTVQGHWSGFDVVVATYEKFYGAIVLTSALPMDLRAVVADELQLVGEDARGPTVELLLARLLKHQESATKPFQLLVLSATLANAPDLSTWLEIEAVSVTRRDPPLEAEIWLPDRRLRFEWGDDGHQSRRHDVATHDIGDVVTTLINEGRGPVAVMATTRRSAWEYAASIADHRAVDTALERDLVDDFRAMEAGSEQTEQLARLLARGVGVHHADLHPEQRAAVEHAFRQGHLEVLVATPTLVAGVNLPIRTVLYPSLTRWNGTADAPISKSEFVNGAGRAGRLGYHDVGTVILLADSIVQAEALADRYLIGESDPVTSKLEGRSTEFLLLHLLATFPNSPAEALASAAGATLWGAERQLRYTRRLLEETSARFEQVLADPRWTVLWERSHGAYVLTSAGEIVAVSGLEPLDALVALDAQRAYHRSRAAGMKRLPARQEVLCRLSTAVGCEDFLPFSARFRRVWANALWPSLQTAFSFSDGLPTARQVVGAAHAFIATGIAGGLPGEVVQEMDAEPGVRTRVSEYLARLAQLGANIGDALDGSDMEPAVSDLRLLADQLQFQATEEVVPFARLFASQPVRFVGPKRIAKLARIAKGVPHRLLKFEDQQLAAAVGEKQVRPVRESVMRHLQGLRKQQADRQLHDVASYPELHGLVERLLRTVDTKFEKAACEALTRMGWPTEHIEQTGNRPRVDGLGQTELGEVVAVECKVAEDPLGSVSRRESFDILKKGNDIDGRFLITVGRPEFEWSAIRRALKLKREGATAVHLVAAGALAEMLIAFRRGLITRSRAQDLLRDFVILDVQRVREVITRSR